MAQPRLVGARDPAFHHIMADDADQIAFRRNLHAEREVYRFGRIDDPVLHRKRQSLDPPGPIRQRQIDAKQQHLLGRHQHGCRALRLRYYQPIAGKRPNARRSAFTAG
jgi:hypothetical protein